MIRDGVGCYVETFKNGNQGKITVNIFMELNLLLFWSHSPSPLPEHEEEIKGHTRN